MKSLAEGLLILLAEETSDGTGWKSRARAVSDRQKSDQARANPDFVCSVTNEKAKNRVEPSRFRAQPVSFARKTFAQTDRGVGRRSIFLLF